ncbi:MAG: hypothetical protein AAGG68_29920 [Bacteroidota bacterium]
MEIQKTAAEFEADIRPYYPNIPNASTRAATDDLIEYADKKEKEGIRTGTLKPRPDENELDLIKDKFTPAVIAELENVSVDLKSLIEDLLAYAIVLSNVVN